MDRPEMLRTAREALRLEAGALQELADGVDESLCEVAEALLECRGHILVTGAGTSGAVAARLAHLLACVGRPALPLSAGRCLHGGSGAITERDVLYVISKGGRSDEVNALCEIAKGRGATIVAQTEAPDSPLGRLADLVLEVKASEGVDPYGMVATGSSLVNAATGDALCAVLLEASGYSREQFAETHPRGAVGRRLGEEEGEGN